MGVILLMTSLISNIYAVINWYIILIIATLLLFHMNFRQVYRMKSVLVTESLFLMNIILLMVGILSDRGLYNYYYITLYMYPISVSFAYIELIGIFIWTACLKLRKNCKISRKPSRIIEEEEKQSIKEITTSYVEFRESKLMEDD